MHLKLTTKQRGSTILIQIAMLLFTSAIIVSFIWKYLALPSIIAERDGCSVSAGIKGKYQAVDLSDPDLLKTKNPCVGQ